MLPRIGLSPARVRGGSAWRGACRSVLRCALALGLVLPFASASAAADPAGLEREIRETREIAAEVSRAVHRVQTENLKLRRTLGTEVQNLTAEDVTATTLRLGRLDADTARLYVTTLENRIANGEAALRLLEEDFERRAADLQGAPETALETLGAQAELQQLREMRTVHIDLIDGLRNLRNAESERLALADEQLALLRSRAELRTIHQAWKHSIRIPGWSRFGRPSLACRTTPCGSTTSPAQPGRNRQPDPARKSLLQLQSGDAIIRSSVRVGDLELIRLADQLDFYGDLVGDDSIPVAILDEAREELDDQRARLEDRLAALSGDRLTLEGQRELVRAQAAEFCRRRRVASGSGAGSGRAPRLPTSRRHAAPATSRRSGRKPRCGDRPERIRGAARTSDVAGQRRALGSGEARADPAPADDRGVLAGDSLGRGRSAGRAACARSGGSRRRYSRAVRRAVVALPHRAGTDGAAERRRQVQRAAGSAASELAVVPAGGDLDGCRADGRRGRASRLASGGRARTVAVGGLPASPQRFAVRRRQHARNPALATAFARALGGPRGRGRRRSGSCDSKRSHAAVGGRPHRSGRVWRSAPDRRRNMVAARGPALFRPRQDRHVADQSPCWPPRPMRCLA